MEGCLTALGTCGTVTGPSFTGAHVGSRPDHAFQSEAMNVWFCRDLPFASRKLAGSQHPPTLSLVGRIINPVNPPTSPRAVALNDAEMAVGVSVKRGDRALLKCRLRHRRVTGLKQPRPSFVAPPEFAMKSRSAARCGWQAYKRPVATACVGHRARSCHQWVARNCALLSRCGRCGVSIKVCSTSK